jgi:MFS transporter, FSR family, fosmidomycin resistance protein
LCFWERERIAASPRRADEILRLLSAFMRDAAPNSVPASAAMPTAVAARLGVITIAHTIVDFLSFVIVPILTVLEGRLNLTNEQGAILLALGSVSSGLIQPAVALLSDKHDTRVVGTIGLLVAALAIGMVGYADAFWQLALIQIVGSAGAGAFHPVAAAAMGTLSGARRSLGVSVFFAAGMIGGIGGNWTTPWWTKTFGVESVLWFAGPGVVAAIALGWAIHSIRHNHAHARQAHADLPAHEQKSRWRSIWILCFGNIIRFTANMCLVQLLIRWSEQAALKRAGAETLDAASRAAAASINGPLQAAMQIGMGVSGLIIGAFLARRHEKAALVLAPLFGGVAIAMFPLAGGMGSAFALAIAAGVGYASIIPLTISLAQRLLPHRTSLASALMMGGAWSIAAVGPPIAQELLDRFGLSVSFMIIGAALSLSGVLSLALRLPRTS